MKNLRKNQSKTSFFRKPTYILQFFDRKVSQNDSQRIEKARKVDPKWHPKHEKSIQNSMSKSDWKTMEQTRTNEGVEP